MKSEPSMTYLIVDQDVKIKSIEAIKVCGITYSYYEDAEHIS